MSDECQRRSLLDRFYGRFLQSGRTAEFIYDVSRHYRVPVLEKLACEGNRISRRAAVLALGLIGDFSSNAVLGERLNDSDRGVRMLADDGIRQLWMRPGNPGIERGLKRVMRLNRTQRFGAALDLAHRLVKASPETAETWNQRALAWSGVEEYAAAAEDCQNALDRNPWHFLAAFGAGNCHLEEGDIARALHCFRTALDINPELDMVRMQIRQLQRMSEGG